MHRLALGALIPAALWLSACGAGDPRATGGSTGSEDTTPPTTAVSTSEVYVLYEADTAVFEQRKDKSPPELCLDGARMLLSVQCGGMPIANWDWDAVEGEESAAGTTWGSYHVVGTVEGGVFTVTEVGPYDPEADAFAGGSHTWPRCPEPAGGWVDVDPWLASEEDYDKGRARARRFPGHVATWTRYVGNPTSEEMMRLEEEGKPLPQKILHVQVTKDAEVAEAAIREAWGGPLCILERDGYTERELVAIRTEAEAFIVDELGLRMAGSWEGEPGLAAEVVVWIDPGGAGQAALDERYGPRMVTLRPVLRPLDGP